MKAFKVKFSHGHFIDIETNKRLIPVQGHEYLITAEDTAFRVMDMKLLIGQILNSEDKEKWARDEFGSGNYVKILDAGTHLCFRVGNSKKVEGDESIQYFFVCILLEDLFLYKHTNKEGNDVKNWRLANCAVKLENCLLGGLTLSERITAKSLNDLFSKTVQFYFSLQRSGSVNVFNTFYLYNEGMPVSFDSAFMKGIRNLGKIREEVVLGR